METKKGSSPSTLYDKRNSSLNLDNKPESERKKQLTVRLEPHQYQLVRLIEDKMGISQAKAVRFLVEKGIGDPI